MRTRHGNDLTISWIGWISSLALISAVIALVINAWLIKDSTLFAACLTVAAIATSGVSGLAGHLQRQDTPAPLPTQVELPDKPQNVTVS